VGQGQEERLGVRDGRSDVVPGPGEMGMRQADGLVVAVAALQAHDADVWMTLEEADELAARRR
jgi:hypothetical protein